VIGHFLRDMREAWDVAVRVTGTMVLLGAIMAAVLVAVFG
jgi:hypothetical protein